jgi:predicted DNA-binding protein (MmcQ/YjbR family)
VYIDEFRDYCLAKAYVTESTPFGPNILVLKVAEKMFAAADIDNFESINLKCDPERAIELREQNDAILPGYHMNKKHWNTVMMDGRVPDNLVRELIDHSYDLVFKSLPAKVRKDLDVL